MSKQKKGARSAATVCLLLLATGCATGAPASSCSAHQATPARLWSQEEKRWRYPHENGCSLSNEGSETFVLYQTSTRDSFVDVLKYYETVGPVDGLADLTSSPGWHEDNLSGYDKVVAVQAGEGYVKMPDERAPNERSFLIRMPNYAITAFIRQEPLESRTRITLIFESKR